MTDVMYALILAGGSGSRLWPLSRQLYPKQLLCFDNSDETLFQSTFSRLNPLFNDRDIITITNVQHESLIKKQLEVFKEKFCRDSDYKILTEPIGRNTCCAIASGVKYIKNLDKNHDPIVFVSSSDNYIENIEKFSQTLETAKKLAQSGYIVTFGVKPSKPDVGLGYIETQYDEALSSIDEKALKVLNFKEKPSFESAQQFMQNNNYFWNSGMFMFKASVFFSELSNHCREIYESVEKIEFSSSSPTIPFKFYENMPDISVDYALMEKSSKLCFLPLESDWSDLGSWEAIYDKSKKDENANCFVGNVIDVGSKDSLIYSTSKLVTTVGLQNLVVVETQDALLVCDKNQTSKVKQIYDKLKANDDQTFRVHKTVFRPWGYYTVLESGDGFLTKCICVNPKSSLSLQYHNHRSEHWVVVQGVATVVRNDEIYELNVAQSIDIKIKEPHSLQNNTNEPVKILEVQCGDILDENDIVRLKDLYGRV